MPQGCVANGGVIESNEKQTLHKEQQYPNSQVFKNEEKKVLQSVCGLCLNDTHIVGFFDRGVVGRFDAHRYNFTRLNGVDDGIHPQARC